MHWPSEKAALAFGRGRVGGGRADAEAAAAAPGGGAAAAAPGGGLSARAAAAAAQNFGTQSVTGRTNFNIN